MTRSSLGSCATSAAVGCCACSTCTAHQQSCCALWCRLNVMLCCAVLCCAVLCCAVLCCAVLACCCCMLVCCMTYRKISTLPATQSQRCKVQRMTGLRSACGRDYAIVVEYVPKRRTFGGTRSRRHDRSLCQAKAGNLASNHKAFVKQLQSPKHKMIAQNAVRSLDTVINSVPPEL